jgi:class 3 adenylate cyclase
LTQARTALVLAEAQLRKLRLEERHGQLLDRQTTLAQVFAFVRGFRDAWQSWPARVAAELAAELGVEQSRVAIALETYVRRHLDELAGARFDLR